MFWIYCGEMCWYIYTDGIFQKYCHNLVSNCFSSTSVLESGLVHHVSSEVEHSSSGLYAALSQRITIDNTPTQSVEEGYLIAALKRQCHLSTAPLSSGWYGVVCSQYFAERSEEITLKLSALIGNNHFWQPRCLRKP